MTDEQGEPTMSAADGRGILGKDFLGGADPAEVVREMRDAEPDVAGESRFGLFPTADDEDAVAIAQELMAEDDETIATPVRLDIELNDGADLVTLSFGPMPIDNLLAMLGYLGSEEGSASFQEGLANALEANLAEQKATGAGRPGP